MQQTNQMQQPGAVKDPLSLRDLTEVLIKHYELHDGKFDLLMEFQIGVGHVAQTPEHQPSPTAMVSISRLGLRQAVIESPNTVDASIVNPLKKKKSVKKDLE